MQSVERDADKCKPKQYKLYTAEMIKRTVPCTFAKPIINFSPFFVTLSLIINVFFYFFVTTVYLMDVRNNRNDAEAPSVCIQFSVTVYGCNLYHVLLLLFAEDCSSNEIEISNKS